MSVIEFDECVLFAYQQRVTVQALGESIARAAQRRLLQRTERMGWASTATPAPAPSGSGASSAGGVVSGVNVSGASEYSDALAAIALLASKPLAQVQLQLER